MDDKPTFSVALSHDGQRITVSVRGYTETMSLGEWSRRIANPHRQARPQLHTADA